jgi:hypothetical protein
MQRRHTREGKSNLIDNQGTAQAQDKAEPARTPHDDRRLLIVVTTVITIAIITMSHTGPSHSPSLSASCYFPP